MSVDHPTAIVEGWDRGPVTTADYDADGNAVVVC